MTRNALLVLVTLVLFGLEPASAASPGTWTASTAGTAATASGAGAAGGAAGRGRGAGATSAGASTAVTLNVSSWSSSEELEELQKLLKAKDTKAFLATLNGYDHGWVTIGGRRVPVDLAWNGTVGGKDVVILVSAKPFSASGSPGSAAGAAVGYVRLTLDSSQSGEGVMYSTTQVGFQGTSGELVARGGASTATKLVDVTR